MCRLLECLPHLKYLHLTPVWVDSCRKIIFTRERWKKTSVPLQVFGHKPKYYMKRALDENSQSICKVITIVLWEP